MANLVPVTGLPTDGKAGPIHKLPDCTKLAALLSVA
jgi:hypothetical protein